MNAPRARILERIAEIAPEAWDLCCPGEAKGLSIEFADN